MLGNHALLAPSSSERWINCPPSAKENAVQQDTSSSYAQQGTDAHALCEYKVKKALGHRVRDPTEDLTYFDEELADGYHIEYSGMKFGLFFVGEYIGIVTISALMVTLFFGGWQGPLLPPFIWFALKTAFFMMMFILIRASLPRPRYDQVMSFGWKICLPLTLINLLVTAAVILWQAQ